MTDYNQPCSDSVGITDSYSRIVAYIKNISEAGLVPEETLYPSNSLIPALPTVFTDTYVNSPVKNVADGFTSTDVMGPNAVIKGLTEGVSVSDSIMNAFVKYLVEGGLLPETTLYPSGTLYPEGGIDVTDVAGLGFSRWLADSAKIVDTISSLGVGKYSYESVNIEDSNIKAIGKYLGEVGTLPETTLYPAEDFYPEGGISVSDIINFGFFRALSDAFSISDVDGINFGVGKNITEIINILDAILFSISSYLQENINILDEIIKGENKSLSDSSKVEDAIVKDITHLLSESMIIDDDVEVLLRTLVRAALRAISVGGSSLRAI